MSGTPQVHAHARLASSSVLPNRARSRNHADACEPPPAGFTHRSSHRGATFTFFQISSAGRSCTRRFTRQRPSLVFSPHLEIRIGQSHQHCDQPRFEFLRKEVSCAVFIDQLLRNGSSCFGGRGPGYAREYAGHGRNGQYGFRACSLCYRNLRAAHNFWNRFGARFNALGNDDASVWKLESHVSCRGVSE